MTLEQLKRYLEAIVDAEFFDPLEYERVKKLIEEANEASNVSSNIPSND